VAALAWSLVSVASETADRRYSPRLKTPFIGNDGGQPPAVAFFAQSPLGTTFVTREGALVHVLVPPTSRERSRGWSLVERFVGGDTGGAHGDAEVSVRVARLEPDGVVRSPAAFSRVLVHRLYPGIDLALEHNGTGIERIYRIAPGADPARIRVALEGASEWRVAQDGRLLVDTPFGTLVQSSPIAWQDTGGRRIPVQVRYRLHEGSYGFEVARFDRSKALHIDPVLATTYIGGSGDDTAQAPAVHPINGDVYVTGSTTSTDFPGIGGGAVPITTGTFYVARLDRELRTLKQATLLPAPSRPLYFQFEYARTLAVHPSTGDVYVIGPANGSFPGLPPSGCGLGIFVARLASDLRTLLGAACVPTTSGPALYASAVAIGTNGDVYVSSAGAFFGGGDRAPQDVFVSPSIARYSSALVLKNAVPIGGGPIAIHPATGDVYAIDLAFPANINRLSPTLATGGVSRLDADYWDVAVHPATGDVYAVGRTSRVLSGNLDYQAIVTRFDGGLSAPAQSVSFGGTGDDVARSVAIDAATGDIYVAGETRSTDFPGTAQGEQSTNAGASDGFVARFPASLETLQRATYFGGSFDDRINGIAFDPASGDFVVSGTTQSRDLLTLPGAAQPSLRGPSDGFIARISKSLTGVGALIALSGSGQTAKAGYPYPNPLSVRLLDIDGVPVSGAFVTFALPVSGPRATFSGGATTAIVITSADGVASSPQLTASLEPGAFAATATAGAASATFSLAIDPASVLVVPADHPAAILLCAAFILLAAGQRLRR